MRHRSDRQTALKKSVRFGTARTINGRISTDDLSPDSQVRPFICHVAKAIGRQLGVDEVRTELLPAGKVSAIEDPQEAGRKVAMVGDGINDAPAP